MPLHLLKLCVDTASIAELEEWIEHVLALKRQIGQTPEQVHTTRMTPKRVEELLDGGSLYWGIKGQIAARQKLIALRPFTDGQGIGRCHLVLEPVVIPVEPRPFRPFQGWRYLEAADAPRDLARAEGDVAIMPETMRRELRELGLI